MNRFPDVTDALMESMRVQAATSAQGFDWDAAAGVLDKVEEEAREIREALEAGDLEHARRELGDLLLVAVNLARFLDASPRDALLGATARFENRFEALRKALDAEGKAIRECSSEELEAYWQRVKPAADELLRKRLDTGAPRGANSRP